MFEFIFMGDSDTGKSGQTEDSNQADIANLLVCHIIFWKCILKVKYGLNLE